MTKTYGIDVSHWEGTIDWQTAAQHVNFCIIKATDGTSFVDPEFSNNKAGCIANNVPWGAYHFFHPSMNPIVQAEHFVGTVGEGCNVYVADIETPVLEELGEGADINALLDGIVELTKQFLDRVEQLIGKKPMIYTSPGFWNYNMVPTPPWTDDYDLWVAHWGASDPMLPNGWTSYVLHQIGDRGKIPGVPGACDEDWFNGDLNAVKDYFGSESPPPPPPQYQLVKITAEYLNMRATPYGTVVGRLRKGNILNVTKTVQDGSGKDWYYSGDHGCFASWWTEPYE